MTSSSNALDTIKVVRDNVKAKLEQPDGEDQRDCIAVRERNGRR
jgi:hypothetical protein